MISWVGITLFDQNFWPCTKLISLPLIRNFTLAVPRFSYSQLVQLLQKTQSAFPDMCPQEMPQSTSISTLHIGHTQCQGLLLTRAVQTAEITPKPLLSHHKFKEKVSCPMAVFFRTQTVSLLNINSSPYAKYTNSLGP